MYAVIIRWFTFSRVEVNFCSLLLLAFVASLTFPLEADAVTPAPDGGYAGGNTAEGTQALQSLTTGTFNTAIGQQALFGTTTGSYNTGEGFRALLSNTTGRFHTATGANALYFETTGIRDVATGYGALFRNTTGSGNVAVGTTSLYNNVTGVGNTAVGDNTLYNSTANYNVAVGSNSLFKNTTGTGNTAVGVVALYNNTTGENNTAVGGQALLANTDGSDNNAVGAFALNDNTTGTFNNAHGREALSMNVDGSENNAFGDLAMENNTTGASNTAIGDDALRTNVTGSFNVAVGDEAGTGLGDNVNNCIAIGAPGDGPFAVLDNTCFIGSIFNQPVSDVGTQEAVFVDQYNVVGISASSRRFKHDIQPMDKSSEAILALKPVTFKYNSDINGRTQYGLVAEDVAEVNPDLVVRRNGEISTVRYEQVNAMLLNEFLKEHKKMQKLEATVAQQKKGMEVLTAQLREQAAQIQRVSAQIQLNKPAPRTVANSD